MQFTHIEFTESRLQYHAVIGINQLLNYFLTTLF